MTDIEPITLVPVGRVHSPVREGRDMPRGGVPAVVEVFPAYAQGLDAIETNSHLVLIGWFDRADRSRLLASPRPRGVFGIRAAVRPNPLGLTVARLLRVDGLRLELDALDFLDGTPIVDIKRYAPGWDCVFSATSSHELRHVAADSEADALGDLMREAAKFHGEACPGAALGVRALRHALNRWQIGQRDPRLLVGVPEDGHLADALQGLTGARFGNGRLTYRGGAKFVLLFAQAGSRESLWFLPRPLHGRTAGDVLAAPEAELFDINVKD